MEYVGKTISEELQNEIQLSNMLMIQLTFKTTPFTDFAVRKFHRLFELLKKL